MGLSRRWVRDSRGSLGAAQSRGIKVLIKMDPYLNIDPGTMSPFQHGEVFVTEDGQGLI